MHPDTMKLLTKGNNFKTKFQAGKYLFEVDCEVNANGVLLLSFDYNPELLAEVKTRFEGRKWLGLNDGPKVWAVPLTHRNVFQFDQLRNKYAPISPYSRWDKASNKDAHTETMEQVLAFWHNRPPILDSKGKPIVPYSHQIDLAAHGLLAKWFIWAAEMGTGKTLASIILMEIVQEKFGFDDWLWIGPRSALVAAKLDFWKWKARVFPEFITYEGLEDLLSRPRARPFRGVIADEASKLKTPTAKRSVRHKYLTDKMRDVWGDDCYIGLLSGTPAPKSPIDWWHLCETTCPGFISESSIYNFKERLAIIVKKESATGGSYPEIVAWRDSAEKCTHCGKEKIHPNHDESFNASLGKQKGMTHQRHSFKPSVNEVAKLASRMRGLVNVKLKKDCLDLPEKRYETRIVKPKRSILNAAKLIAETSTRAIDALTRLRELSDGFQYVDEKTGEEVCSLCEGRLVYAQWFAGDIPLNLDEVEQKRIAVYDQEDGTISEYVNIEPERREIECPNCNGTGRTPIYKRSSTRVECPKDQVLIDLLEEHEEYGRLNVYAGFQASVDRVCDIAHQAGWFTIRADGRGWEMQDKKGVVISTSAESMMKLYQDPTNTDWVCFVGQAGAAGMGLTLTRAFTTLFYSNDFNAENRLQAEDRGHRIGMDKKRGGRIIDIIHLPSDTKILENLRKKRDLQLMSMTGVREAFEQELKNAERTSD